MKESKKVAQIINLYLNRKETFNQLYKSEMTVEKVKEYIGEIIKYYIMTRDDDIDIDLDDIIGRSIAIQRNAKGYTKNGKYIEYNYNIDEIKENTNENGFVTHSFNSYLEEKVRKNGLRTSKNK